MALDVKSKNFFGFLAGLGWAMSHLYTAGLAAPSGFYLGFDNNCAANSGCCCLCFFRCICDSTL